MKSIFTSYYGFLRKDKLDVLGANNYQVVSISRIPLRNSDFIHYPILAPSFNLLLRYKKDHNIERYIIEFENYLSQLDPLKVYDDLPDKCILVCYENSSTFSREHIYENPKAFCHRHIAADWLMNKIPHLLITELNNEHIQNMGSQDIDCNCDNPEYGFSCVCNHIKQYPGNINFYCKYCGIYTSSKPICENCLQE